MTNQTAPLLAAFHDAVTADAAFEAFNASSFVVTDPERLFSLSNRAIDARANLATAIAGQGKEDIALHGYTLRGRLITLNQSAQQPGKLQLTRFDQHGEPWGDTQYDSPIRAIKEFLDEIEIATLQDIEQSFSPASRPMPDFIEVAGHKRATRASNGRLIHHTEAGIRNFWAWYGNTGLTDDAGRPTVFFHGTHKDFSGFSEEKLGSTTNADWATLGHFFTPSPDLASKFSKGKLWDKKDAPYRSGANVIPAFVALRNPMRVPASQMLPLSGSEAGINRLLSEAKALGHDGIIIGTWKESFGTEDPTGELASPQYIAFSGSQIKSALGNDGAFSTSGNDLLFSRTGQEATHSTEGIPLAFHNRSDGNTYFIADNISEHASDAALKGLLRHELGLHALRTGRHQKDWEHLLSEIAKLRDEGDKQVLSAWKKARAAGTEERNMLEETAGYLVQDAPDSSIGRKILSWFKSAVQRVTRIKLSLTSADIAEMAQRALNKAPRLLMRQNRDESDLVKDANGTPLRAFRGQHGPDDGSLIQTRLGAISFGSAGAAFTYASTPNRRHDTTPNPRITAAYLRIANPFINTPDDPFIELGDIEDKLGHAEATRIALKFADAILNTDNWYEISKETGLASVDAFLKAYPDRVRDLYFDAYLLLDDVQEIEKIKDAGYDGAIHGGNGETALEAEYKVFNVDQIVSPETVKIESLVSPDARTATNTDEFRAWFGASKVVGNNGDPLILYHGTNESFDAFDWDRSREDGTVFASPNQRVASDFALYRSTWGGANVMPVYVKADRLLEIDGHGEAIRKVEDSAKFDDMKYGETVREYARRQGYDGIVFRNVYDDVGPDIAPRDDVWAFFGSAQIKSAIGNSGAFDRNSNNILFSKAPSVAANTTGFRAWFGESKAVDETGKPLVLYRGDNPGKTVFTGREDASAYIKGNIFFSSNPAVAKNYAKPRPNYMRDAASLDESDGLYRAHLAMQNPLVVDAKGEFWSEIPLPPALAEAVGAFRGVMQIDDLAAEAQRLGHDGLLVKNVLDQFGDGDQYVVFSPEQVKSATGNNGQFARNNPNFLFSKSPAPWHYSQLAAAIATAPDKSFGNAEQLSKWLTANQHKLHIRKEELHWTGLLDWLALQGKGTVTRHQVTEYLDNNGTRVHEVIKGRPNHRNLDEEYDAAADAVNAAIRNRAPLQEQDRLREIRDDLRDQIDDSAKDSSAPRFAKHVIPGGENYKELLLTLPSNTEQFVKSVSASDEWAVEFIDGTKATFPLSKADDKQEAIDYATRQHYFKSKHWDEKNILAHIRFNDRTSADGKRVLFIEELQSDWGQTGKKDGFNTKRIGHQVFVHGVAAGNAYEDLSDAEKHVERALKHNPPDAVEIREVLARRSTAASNAGVPEAPFVTDTKAWAGLAIKRMIRYAAENGYDKIAFITGQQSADRYDLSKQVESVVVTRLGGGSQYHIEARKNNGEKVTDRAFPADAISDVIGKELAERAISDTSGEKDEVRYSGVDLQVGGEGMKAFYDEIIPQVANDVLRRIGGDKMGPIRLSGMASYEQLVDAGKRSGLSQKQLDAMPVAERKSLIDSLLPPQPSLDITPDIRDLVLGRGMPLFSKDAQRPESGMTTEKLRARLAGIFGSDFVDGLEASGKVKFITARQAEAITGEKMHAFAGPTSATADKIRLEAAQRRHEAGEHPENIRRETGWFRGVDGKWRYEISDHLAELDDSAWYADSDVHGEPCRKMIGTLGDVMQRLNPTAAARLGYSEHLQKGLLQHADLLAAYPELATIELEIRESNGFLSAARGHYRGSTPPRVALNINPSLGGSVIGALTHEIQHAIQAIEQFARGGSPTDYSGDANRLAAKAQIEDAARTILEIKASPEYVAADRAYADAGMTEQALEIRNATPAHSRMRSLSKSLQALLKEVGLPMNARIIRDIAENGFSIDDIPDLGLVRYMRLAGEAEARNAETRRSLTPDERQTTAPASTCDTPEEDQIVLHHRMSA